MTVFIFNVKKSNETLYIQQLAYSEHFKRYRVKEWFARLRNYRLMHSRDLNNTCIYHLI